MTRKLFAGVLAGALVLAFAAPALAHKQGSPRHHHGGKKPIGEVVSFDGTTLSVLKHSSGETVSGTVTEDTRIKLDHRGRPAAKRNPTRGSVEDLVAGTKVLRLKLDDGMVEKVKLRKFETYTPPPAECDDDAEGDEAESDEGDEGDGDDDAEGEGENADEDADEIVQASEGDDCDDDDADDSDEDEDEDEEDDEDDGLVDEIEDALPLS